MMTELETNTGKKIKRLWSDNGTEILSTEFQQWIKWKGIIHEKWAPYYPEPNGKAERLQKTLMEMARCYMKMISRINGYEKLCDEAVKTPNVIWNRMFTESCKSVGKTPYESVMNKKPNLSFLRKFGTTAFVHIPKNRQKGKLYPRKTDGILIRYAAGSGYRTFVPSENKNIVSTDVKFIDENWNEAVMQHLVENNSPI